MSYPGYTTEEIGKRGTELYERKIRPKVEREHDGRFLSLDIVTGDYEISDDDLASTEQLLVRRPEAVVFFLQIGRPPLRVGAANPTTSQ